MIILRSILLALEVFVSLVLILIILMQKSKSGGGGLGTAFGGGMSESMFGSRAGDVLTKLTIILTVVFLANTLVLAIMTTGGESKSLIDEYSEPGQPVSQQAPIPQPVSAPNAGQPAQAPIAPTLPFSAEPAADAAE